MDRAISCLQGHPGRHQQRQCLCAHRERPDSRLRSGGANGEPAYEFLEGKWLTNSNYYVIHRFATLPKLQREGYARIFINKVCSLCEVEHVPSIKVDTNYDNLPMVSLLSSMGFCLCGKVSYGERGLRFAFEKITMRPKG